MWFTIKCSDTAELDDQQETGMTQKRRELAEMEGVLAFSDCLSELLLQYDFR